MKYKLNIKPIIIEAESKQEAWKEFETGDYIYEVNDMEEIEKGCGEIIEFKNDKFDNLWECKDGFLCLTCKAKLQILKESRMIFIQEELERIEKIKEEDCFCSFGDNLKCLSCKRWSERISQLQKELKELEDGEE